ncbi:MAG: hypothetical protein WD801_15285 [Gemmatimonadaceae bacterium]
MDFMWPAPVVAGPVIAPLGYARPTGPLVMRLLPGGSTLNGWHPVPRDEADGFVSEERKRYAEARLMEPADVAARGGGASFTTGWLGRGPSREQRARDSTIHAGNLLRLAGLAALAARAQAKRDSVRAADSLAKDTLSRAFPPPFRDRCLPVSALPATGPLANGRCDARYCHA